MLTSLIFWSHPRPVDTHGDGYHPTPSDDAGPRPVDTHTDIYPIYIYPVAVSSEKQASQMKLSGLGVVLKFTPCPEFFADVLKLLSTSVNDASVHL